MIFTKVEGCGNHFILIDQSVNGFSVDDLSAAQVRELCDPHFGIGADGVLWVRCLDDHHPRYHHGHYEMIVYNTDGSLAEMCGNGLRCVVQYLHQHKHLCEHPENSAWVLTGAGPLEVFVNHQKQVGVHMGWPQIMTPEILAKSTLPIEHLSFYSLGNPHMVSFELEYFERRELLAPDWGKSIQGGVNVSFAHLHSSYLVDLHVYERGCGWTLGCGTGACATVYHGYREGVFELHSSVTVNLPGGSLSIDLAENGLTMWGEAREVYRGVYFSRC